jgi:transglutaminase-like putative cysteine protease
MWERLKLEEGWSTFFLLLAMLVSAAVSISAARWTSGLESLVTASILGFLAGFMLSKSRFPAMLDHLFSLAYGLFTVGYLMGRLVDRPGWPERLSELGERVATWLTKATSGGTSRDSLMFVLLLAALFWLLGHIAAWYTFRRPRLWRVLLPLGLTMLVNYYVYTDPRISAPGTASLAPFLAVAVWAALLYTVRTNVYLHELEWQNAHVSYTTDLRLDFVRSGTALAVIALLVMTIAPGAQASPQISDVWQGIEDARDSVRDTVLRLFGSLDTRGRGVGNPFGSRALLGGARDLGDEVLFDVIAGQGRYWQAAVYDRYTGDSWLNSDDKQLLLPAGERLHPNFWLTRREMTQTITVYLPNTTQLYAAPEPVRVPGFAVKASISFDQGQVSSVSSIYARNALRPGNTYQIVSAVSQADPDTLRAAGAEYPDWIRDRHLQLPGTVTERTRNLAEEITAGYDNAYDKATAIEQYLRHNLRYNLAAPGPPEGQDFVDFVLFDLQTGYCDYYASSFVVLARSVGIPARIVYGYAQDEYNLEAKAYRVRADNGHSWPEVFFPQYGWVQFEPTVVIAPIDRPLPPAPSNTDPANPANAGQTDEQNRDPLLPEEPDAPPGAAPEATIVNPDKGISPVFFVLAGTLVIAVLAVAVTYWSTERRGLNGMSLVERAYARMWRFAAWLGVPAPPDQTPYERAQVLTILVPESHGPIQNITDMYVVERFGRGSGNGDGSNAEEQWSLLRPSLWKNWLQKKVGRLQRDQKRRWEEFSQTYPTHAKTGGRRPSKE